MGFYPAITSKPLSPPCGQLSQEGFPDATMHGQRDSSPFPQASGYPGSSRVRMQVVSPPGSLVTGAVALSFWFSDTRDESVN